MTTAQVNYLNIAFMILSGVVAFVLPFELFVFSYAILGPLHYLTEMSWLQKRQFFAPGKRDYLLLAALSLVIIFPAIFKICYHFLAAKDAGGKVIYSQPALQFLHRAVAMSKMMVFVSFGAAAVLILFRSHWKRAVGLAGVAAFAILFRSQAFITVFFALFLPTLIHVFVFTGIFILSGAIKSKSSSGYVSLLVFVGCAVGLLVIPYYPGGVLNSSVVDSYHAGVGRLNKAMFHVFVHQPAAANDIYHSGTGILITRFIAYAYTYHYLNWFSKTSVIRWHEVPKSSLVLIVALWLLSVALYFTNYRTGLAALYFLSLLHVIFEFPLNIQTIRDVGRVAFKKVI